MRAQEQANQTKENTITTTPIINNTKNVFLICFGDANETFKLSFRRSEMFRCSNFSVCPLHRRDEGGGENIIYIHHYLL